MAVEDTAAAVTVAVEGTAAAVTVAVEDTAAAAVTVAVEDTAAATVAVAVEDTGGEQEIERTVPEVAVDPSRECSGIAASEAVLKPMPVPEVFQRVQHRYHKITVPLSGCVATVPIGAEPPRVGASGIAQLSPSPKRCATPPLHAQPISQAHLRPYGRHLRLSPSARIPTPRVGQIGAENGGGIPVPLEQPVMPFVNGLIKKLVTLSEFPDFIKANSNNVPAHNAFVDNHGMNPSGLLVVQSPPSMVREDFDPPTLLPVVNTGKVRAVANLLLIIRSTQITPFRDLVVHTGKTFGLAHCSLLTHTLTQLVYFDCALLNMCRIFTSVSRYICMCICVCRASRTDAGAHWFQYRRESVGSLL